MPRPAVGRTSRVRSPRAFDVPRYRPGRKDPSLRERPQFRPAESAEQSECRLHRAGHRPGAERSGSVAARRGRPGESGVSVVSVRAASAAWSGTASASSAQASAIRCAQASASSAARRSAAGASKQSRRGRGRPAGGRGPVTAAGRGRAASAALRARRGRCADRCRARVPSPGRGIRRPRGAPPPLPAPPARRGPRCRGWAGASLRRGTPRGRQVEPGADGCGGHGRGEPFGGGFRESRPASRSARASTSQVRV